MAVIENNRTVPLGAITTHGVVALVDRGLAALRAWRIARLTETTLLGLSDRELADIGTFRGAIGTRRR